MDHVEALIDALRAIMPRAGDRAAQFAPHIESARARFGITSPRDVAMFLAQIAYESGELRYVREIASGEAYEGRRDLGNTEPGDGPRFRGRGLIQLTGRDNYRRCGQALGVDLIADPDRLAEPQLAAWSAGWFWRENGLTGLAEGPDPIVACTRRINGGLNGLADRKRYYDRALVALRLAGEQPPAPIIESTPTWEAPAMTPFVAAALPALVQSIPELIRSFGNGAVTERNAKAAEAVLQVVQTATGTPNTQAAIEAIQTDPGALQAARQALERDLWFETTEAGGGGISGAREFNAKISDGNPLMMPALWISILLLVPVYAVIGAVVFGDGWSAEIRIQVVTAVLATMGIVGAFWLGSSFGTTRGRGQQS